jgi:hypothetical protein
MQSTEEVVRLAAEHNTDTKQENGLKAKRHRHRGEKDLIAMGKMKMEKREKGREREREQKREREGEMRRAYHAVSTSAPRIVPFVSLLALVPASLRKIRKREKERKKALCEWEQVETGDIAPN